MFILSEVRELQDGSRLTEYSGRTGIYGKYVFLEMQSTINFHNEGSKPITLTINGVNYTVAGGERKNITKNIKEFTVNASGSVPFSIRAWEVKNVRVFGAKKPIAVATRCTAHHTGTTLAGTVAGVTYRYAHVMRTKATNLQLVFANFYPTATSESSNANAINVAVAIEYNGQTTRLHFGGKRVVTIDQGGIAETDTFMRDIPEGETFYTRTWISVPVDGNTFPQGIACNSALGDGKGTGDLAVATGALTASTEQGYGPSAIIGIPDDDNAVAFALIGDSIVADGNGKGWPVQAVENDYGYMILSRPSSTVDTMEFTSGNAYRYRMVKYATHAICDYGTNDFNNANALNDVVDRFGDLWDVLKSSGLVVYHSTTLPRTTSTDSWATVGNQTAVSTNSYSTKRATFNASLRNGEYPVIVLDIASAAESATGASGVWKAAYTSDGIHPIQAGIDAMVANISLGLD